MAPVMPGKAQALWVMLGRAGAVAESGWPGLPVPGAWRSRPDGTPLGAVAGLFAKIDDATIEAEQAALRA